MSLPEGSAYERSPPRELGRSAWRRVCLQWVLPSGERLPPERAEGSPFAYPPPREQNDIHF